MYTSNDVPPYKSVNGVEVEMTPEERQETADRWNAATPSKQQRITEKLQSVGYVQEWMLDRDIGYALSLAQLAGVSEPTLYASNAAYHMAKDLKEQLDAIRAEP